MKIIGKILLWGIISLYIICIIIFPIGQFIYVHYLASKNNSLDITTIKLMKNNNEYEFLLGENKKEKTLSFVCVMKGKHHFYRPYNQQGGGGFGYGVIIGFMEFVFLTNDVLPNEKYNYMEILCTKNAISNKQKSEIITSQDYQLLKKAKIDIDIELLKQFYTEKNRNSYDLDALKKFADSRIKIIWEKSLKIK